MKDRGERLNSAPGAVIFLSFSIGRVWRHLFINYIGAAFLSFDFVVFLLREWFKSETKQNKKAENTSQNSSSSSGYVFFFQLLNEGSPIKRWASASLPVMSSFTHPFASRICLFCFFIFYFLPYFTTSIRREKFWQDRQTHTARLRKCVCSVVCVAESFFVFP